jgi:hypothetical protein
MALFGLVFFGRPLSATKHKHSELTNISENTRDWITTCEIQAGNTLTYSIAVLDAPTRGLAWTQVGRKENMSRGRHSFQACIVMGFKRTLLVSVGIKQGTVYDEHIIRKNNSYIRNPELTKHPTASQQNISSLSDSFCFLILGKVDKVSLPE